MKQKLEEICRIFGVFFFPFLRSIWQLHLTELIEHLIVYIFCEGFRCDLCVLMFYDWKINEVNYVLQITPNFREASTPSPSSSPSPSASNHVQNDHNSSQQVLSQIWQRSGSCPDGTIPIRRIQRRDLLRATGLEHFGKKPANSYHSTNDEKGSVIINGTRVELGPQVNRSVSKRYVLGSLDNHFSF